MLVNRSCSIFTQALQVTSFMHQTCKHKPANTSPPLLSEHYQNKHSCPLPHYYGMTALHSSLGLFPLTAACTSTCDSVDGAINSNTCNWPHCTVIPPDATSSYNARTERATQNYAAVLHFFITHYWLCVLTYIASLLSSSNRWYKSSRQCTQAH
jgi:hypothetical protein